LWHRDQLDRVIVMVEITVVMPGSAHRDRSDRRIAITGSAHRDRQGQGGQSVAVKR
jgi:hypothetical protein